MVDVNFQWPILPFPFGKWSIPYRFLKLPPPKNFLLFSEILNLGTSNAKYDVCVSTILHLPPSETPSVDSF